MMKQPAPSVCPARVFVPTLTDLVSLGKPATAGSSTPHRGMRSYERELGVLLRTARLVA